MDKFLTGQLLIASPYLSDQNFLRTVCYMVRHDEEGAFGLILNRPSDMLLSEVLKETIGSPSRRDDSIFLGGPVEGPLCALHDDGNFADLDCGPGLFVTSDQESLTAIANRNDINARFFAGYSGWGSGQLEGELEHGGWMICDADPGDVFCDPDSVWEDVVKRVGRSIISESVPMAIGADVDPSLN